MANIVQTAMQADNFKTLVKAIQAAGLSDTLSGQGPFTVFAPTDEAFSKLPYGTLDSLLKDIPKLKSILTYHVVQGKVSASDIMKQRSAKSLQGEDLSIESQQGNVRINEARVIKADIMCDNGIIHAIDSVLMPKVPAGIR